MHQRDDKCKKPRNEIEWLGFDISEKGMRPHNETIRSQIRKMKTKNFILETNDNIYTGLAQTTEPSRELSRIEDDWE